MGCHRAGWHDHCPSGVCAADRSALKAMSLAPGTRLHSGERERERPYSPRRSCSAPTCPPLACACRRSQDSKTACSQTNRHSDQRPAGPGIKAADTHTEVNMPPNLTFGMCVRRRQARTTSSASHISPTVKCTFAPSQKELSAPATSARQASTHCGRKSIPSALQQKRRKRVQRSDNRERVRQTPGTSLLVSPLAAAGSDELPGSASAADI